MRLPKPRPLLPAVPVAGLADVTLLLVFFFVIATRFEPGSGPIALPQAPCRHEAPPGSVTIQVERRAAPTGETLSWHVDSGAGERLEVTGPEGLYFPASRIVDKDPERIFLLRIDASVRYAVVDDALEWLRKAGVRNVVFGAQPEEGT